MECLTRNNKEFSVMETITRKNIEHSSDFYKYFHSRGISCGFFMVKKVSDDLLPTIDQLDNLVSFIYDYLGSYEYVFDIIKFADNMNFNNLGFPIAHCGSGINAISISPNGNVYPCVLLMNEKYRMGDLLSQSGVNKFKEERLKRIESDLISTKMECQPCDYKWFCGGGCRADNIYRGCQVNRYRCKYYKLGLEIFMKREIERKEHGRI